MLGSRIARSRGLWVASAAQEAAAARFGASHGGVRSSLTRIAPFAENFPLNNSRLVSGPSARVGTFAGKQLTIPVASARNSVGETAAFSTNAAAANMYAVCVEGGQLGIRASRALQRGDVLFDFVKGAVFDRPGRHTIQISDDRHLETQSDLRLLNHSCDPNCRMEIDPSEQDPYLRIVVMMTVEPGEPLTIDYNAMEIEMSNPFDCLCGTSGCAGRVAGFSRLPIDARNEYLAHGQDHSDDDDEQEGWQGRKNLRLTPLVRAWAAENKDAPPRP